MVVFQVSGTHLKKMRRAEGGAKIFGVFRVKNHDFAPKIICFPISGGARGPHPTPESGTVYKYIYMRIAYNLYVSVQVICKQCLFTFC